MFYNLGACRHITSSINLRPLLVAARYVDFFLFSETLFLSLSDVYHAVRIYSSDCFN